MVINLVAEDGSGRSDANSYADLPYLLQYHSDRGNAYWANLSSDEVRKALLIRSTDYIEKRFTRLFRGFRMIRDQSLAWPRLNAYDDDKYMLEGVPEKLKKALAEYALRAAIYNVLAPDPVRATPKQDMSATDPQANYSSDLIIGPVRSKTTKVGPIEEITVHDSLVQVAQLARAGSSSRATQSDLVNDIYIPMYPEADMLIEDLLMNRASIALERA